MFLLYEILYIWNLVQNQILCLFLSITLLFSYVDEIVITFGNIALVCILVSDKIIILDLCFQINHIEELGRREDIHKNTVIITKMVKSYAGDLKTWISEEI
jgi:hypothetical protein